MILFVFLKICTCVVVKTFSLAMNLFSLQSGTCPVCRRHFPPAVIEASAAASSEPGHDAPPSNDSTEDAP